jgi:hypothetical protein
MLKRLLNEEREAGTLHSDVDINKVVGMIFSGLLGASVMYTSDKSVQNLEMTISTLVEYLTQISD